jgi:hypothetical protein
LAFRAARSITRIKSRLLTRPWCRAAVNCRLPLLASAPVSWATRCRS